MKIDIHVHTKPCKKGDAPTRAISPEDFCEAILSSEVKIVAITNHNIFDFEQYTAIRAQLRNEAQVWPGIELDILEQGSRGHLLVIVSPTLANEFSETVIEFTKGSRVDSFATAIDQVLRMFDPLRPLYVAHYAQKQPSLSDLALEKLIEGTKNPSRVIREVTNSISAGIYISHGHPSLYGSDVQDWAKYEELSRSLPDLRLPVDSFEHFCLLLEKDPTTINTALDRKTSEDLTLLPFDDGSTLSIRAFDDINVVFGPKGTGKSCILRAIAKHYSENGVEARVYESASDRLDELFDMKGKDLTINLNDLSINYCTSEIEALRAASEVAVTSISKYIAYFAAKTTSRNAKKIRLKDIEPEEESWARREFDDFSKAAGTTASFLNFLVENPSLKKELTQDEQNRVIQILSDLLRRLTMRKWLSFSAWKEIWFLNSAIKVFRREVERKTGSPAKPTTTGFRAYAMNRAKIRVAAAEVLKNVGTKIPLTKETLGSLGSNKGELEFRTEYEFQSGNISDSSLSSLSAAKKGPQKKFIGCIRKILKRTYDDDLFQCISELNEIEDGEFIKTVYELLLFRRYFALDGVRYSPSSGEASMVMLQKELGTDKEVYILDEPERSLGNEYISDVIVPRIKERARAGKKVFISTHDANIAVRTLPYSSIYRCHGQSGYATYVGNPFSNNLVNILNEKDCLDWKKISMRTLEGGEEAFGERGKIYGSD
jgi:ABC-type cobalamin/Fe3+-siderophores transport system ATPase subunit